MEPAGGAAPPFQDYETCALLVELYGHWDRCRILTGSGVMYDFTSDRSRRGVLPSSRSVYKALLPLRDIGIAAQAGLEPASLKLTA